MSRSKIFIALICFLLASWAQADSYKQKLRTFHSAQEFQQMTAGKLPIQRNLDPQQQITLRLAVMRWPTTDFTVIAVESPAVTWIGTKQGAIRLSEDQKKLEYFAGQRWLLDDHVTGIAFDDN